MPRKFKSVATIIHRWQRRYKRKGFGVKKRGPSKKPHSPRLA